MMRIINRSLFACVLAAVVVLFCVCSCSDMLDVELDKSKVDQDRVFSDDVVATSAMNGLYSQMFQSLSFASGSDKSVTAWAGLLADELETYSTDPAVNQFEQNDVKAENAYVLNLWSSMYNIIYQANAVITGLSESPSVTPAKKEQLEGEAMFIRAFCYFYLINFYGDVPLNLTTDFRINSIAGKSTSASIYAQIVDDLNAAEAKLSSEYATADRGRPNQAAATALKARVALFREEWSDAELHASKIIGDEKYSLAALDYVFKTGSPEAIWQLRPVETPATNEGAYFILMMNPIFMGNNTLRSEFVESFVLGDARRDQWIGTYTDGTETWYYPFKYKISAYDIAGDESSNVLRLAEQYLIRAEARVHGGDIDGAMADVDSIRSRASLPLISTSGNVVTTDSLLSLIKHERRMEFFAEWGHRWLDLKRHDELTPVLSVIKTYWNAGDELLPIPQEERNRNPALGN